MLNFLNISCAANFLLDNFRAPYFFAACSAWALCFYFSAAAWFVNAAACARIVFPCAWIANAFFNNWTRNMFCYSFPFATANINIFGFCNWFANGVTVVTVASLSFSFVCCAAYIPVAGFVYWFANGVAAFTVASFVNRLACGVAAFTVAGFVYRFAGGVCAISVAGFVNRLACGVCAISVTGFVNWFAYRVTFIAVACFRYVFVALYGDFFANSIIYSFAAGVIFFHPNSFFNCFVAS